MSKEMTEEEQILDYLKRNPIKSYNDELVDDYEDDGYNYQTEEDVARDLYNER